MDKNWFSTPREIREGIKYLSAHFYPVSIMDRWSILKKLSFEKAKIIASYSLQQVIEELEHFDFFKEYFREDPLSSVQLRPHTLSCSTGWWRTSRAPGGRRTWQRGST